MNSMGIPQSLETGVHTWRKLPSQIDIWEDKGLVHKWQLHVAFFLYQRRQNCCERDEEGDGKLLSFSKYGMFWNKHYVQCTLICILNLNAFYICILHIHFKKTTKIAESWPCYRYIFEQWKECKSYIYQFYQQKIILICSNDLRTEFSISPLK